MLKKDSNLIKKLFTAVALGCFVFSIGVHSVQAQQMQQQQQEVRTDYSDEELEQFVDALLEVMPLQDESQEKMIEEIEDQGLTIDQFNEIMAQKENPEVEVEATEEELEAFEKAMEEVQNIQMEYNMKINGVIEENEMTPEEYEMIIMAYQQDTELRERIDEMIAEKEEDPPIR